MEGYYQSAWVIDTGEHFGIVFNDHEDNLNDSWDGLDPKIFKKPENAVVLTLVNKTNKEIVERRAMWNTADVHGIPVSPFSIGFSPLSDGRHVALLSYERMRMFLTLEID